jgi:hypothetical protein
MQQQYMPHHPQQQQQQQLQQGAVAWHPWGQEGGGERGGLILPASSLRGCYEGKTPIDGKKGGREGGRKGRVSCECSSSGFDLSRIRAM